MVVTNRNIVHNYCWVWPRQQEVDNVRNVPSWLSYYLSARQSLLPFVAKPLLLLLQLSLRCQQPPPAPALAPATMGHHATIAQLLLSKQQHQHSAVGQMGRWLAMGGGNGCRLVPGTSCVKGLEAQSKLAAKAAIPAVPNQQRSGTCTTAVANLCCDWYAAPVHACGYL